MTCVAACGCFTTFCMAHRLESIKPICTEHGFILRLCSCMGPSCPFVPPTLPLKQGALPFARRTLPSGSWPDACRSAIAFRYPVLWVWPQQERLPQLHGTRMPPRLPLQEDHLHAATA